MVSLDGIIKASSIIGPGGMTAVSVLPWEIGKYVFAGTIFSLSGLALAYGCKRCHEAYQGMVKW